MYWRPDNWAEVLDKIRLHWANPIEDRIGELDFKHRSLVEAGADAMLKVFMDIGIVYEGQLEWLQDKEE